MCETYFPFKLCQHVPSVSSRPDRGCLLGYVSSSPFRHASCPFMPLSGERAFITEDNLLVLCVYLNKSSQQVGKLHTRMACTSVWPTRPGWAPPPYVPIMPGAIHCCNYTAPIARSSTRRLTSSQRWRPPCPSERRPITQWRPMETTAMCCFLALP